MKDYFFFDFKVDHLLFYGFSCNSPEGMVGMCFLIGGIAFLFEFLRYIQTKQKQKELKLRVMQLKLVCPTESAALINETVTNPRNPLNITIFDRALMFGTEISLWLLLQNLGYFIMLAVMIYNTWFLVAACIGGALGYFIFGQRFMKINVQNCEIMRDAFCTHIITELPDNTNQREGESTPAAATPSTSHNNLECHQNKNLIQNHNSNEKEVEIKVECH